MTSNVVARIAGWSAILSVLAIVPAILLVVTNSGQDTPLGTTLFLLSTVLLAPVFYALYVLHRAQAQSIALVALVLGLLCIVAGVIAPTPTVNAMIFNASSLLGGIAIMLFGYLGLTHPKMPRALAVVAILLGVASAVSIVVDIVGLGLIVLIVVWLLWLAWLLLRGKLI